MLHIEVEDHIESLPGHERTHHDWFSWKKIQLLIVFPIANSLSKIPLIYWMTLVFNVSGGDATLVHIT